MSLLVSKTKCRAAYCLPNPGPISHDTKSLKCPSREATSAGLPNLLPASTDAAAVSWPVGNPKEVELTDTNCAGAKTGSHGPSDAPLASKRSAGCAGRSLAVVVCVEERSFAQIAQNSLLIGPRTQETRFST